MRIPFATQSYKHPSLPISAQQCINFYAEREPQDAKTEGHLAVLSAPGVIFWGTTNAGPIRAMRVVQDEVFVVAGTDLYTIPQTGGAGTLIGSGITNVTENISISDNGRQVIIVTFDGVSGGGGWLYDRGTAVFSPIIDPNFKPGYTVTFYDGYFIVPVANTTEWIFSGILDGALWNPLDFNSALVDSSLILGIIEQQENLLIFKEHVTETWYDTGNNDDPFTRYDGATIERGTAAPKTILKEDNSVFFLGDDLIFYRLDGVLPRRVSTHALEALWRTYPTDNINTTYAFSYTFNGHKFVNLIFPAGPGAFVYDISSGLWHERSSYDSNGNFFPLWRQSYVVSFFGSHTLLVGDNQSGNVGIMTDASYTEFGNLIVGELVSPPLEKDRKRIFLPLFELDIEAGVGNSPSAPGLLASNPQFMLQISKDGGRTYGNLQQWQSMGKQGEFQTRLRWKKLGQARQLVLKVIVSDPVPRRIIGAYGDISVGM